MKRCFKCGIEKPLDSFYKHPMMGDGHLGKCKGCTQDDVRANYRSNREYYQAYYKARSQTPHRKTQEREYRKRKDARRSDRRKAYGIVMHALRSGKLKKQPCEHCGALKVDAHHENYSQPLKVRWLCRQCHADEHNRVRA